MPKLQSYIDANLVVYPVTDAEDGVLLKYMYIYVCMYLFL